MGNKYIHSYNLSKQNTFGNSTKKIKPIFARKIISKNFPLKQSMNISKLKRVIIWLLKLDVAAKVTVLQLEIIIKKTFT